MGRKKLVPPSKDVQAVDALVVREEQTLQQKEEEIQRVEQLYGDGEPYDPGQLIVKSQFAAKVTAEAMETIGKACLRIKAHEEHGFFMEAVKRIGITQDYAWFTMTAVEKFGNFDARQNLSATKMRSMLVFEKPVIQEYLNGGDLAGIPHDEVSRMSSRELDAEVRRLSKKLKEDRKALEDTIAKKNEKINELEMEVLHQEPPTKEQLARVVVQRFQDPIIDNILEATERMRRAIAAIDEAQKVPDVPCEALEELLDPYKESFNTFCDTAEDLTSAFNNIHIDKGRG
jgi:hypothetical protein